eukprot:CAMPEP_0198288740 /NCGR_PEP_ID=MMETSP1449-20131203/7155_1 /TAXON_ID=420275 /ORGANISM="Attheya septentrionalis, Strain CCMP2084" /LENGTH=351 /DNA_ID=CAMNT_0043986945 /DNA_START=73 /DNA_END=1128 /DNA_ORIENTATION=+
MIHPSSIWCSRWFMGYDKKGNPRRGCQTASFAVVILILRVLVVLSIVLFIGCMKEGREAKRAPSTLKYYESSSVCGIFIPDSLETSNGTLTSVEQRQRPSVQEEETRHSIFGPENRGMQRTVNNSIIHDSQQRHPMLRNRREAIDLTANGAMYPSRRRRTKLYSTTFNAESEAREAMGESGVIGHCGDCGACSNPHDITIYDYTKNSLTGDATKCAVKGMIGGRRFAGRCLYERVGLSPKCNNCWVENIICDLKLCVFSCIWHLIKQRFQGGATKGNKGSLNACTYCDEKRCGPEFIRCAGANRRRTGILSDIDRDISSEVCKAVDQKWWETRNDLLEEYRLDNPRVTPIP